MLFVEGIRCTACVWLIERSLQSLPGVATVQVNALAQRARITWIDKQVSLSQILERLARTGYRAWPLHAKALDDLRRHEARDALKRLVVAGFGAMQAMMFAAALYLRGADALDASADALFRWLGFIVATPVVLYSAAPFFKAARRALAARRLSMTSSPVGEALKSATPFTLRNLSPCCSADAVPGAISVTRATVSSRRSMRQSSVPRSVVAQTNSAKLPTRVQRDTPGFCAALGIGGSRCVPA